MKGTEGQDGNVTRLSLLGVERLIIFILYTHRSTPVSMQRLRRVNHPMITYLTYRISL